MTALDELVRALDGQPDLNPHTLASALNIDLGIDDVAPYIRFDPANYVRSLIAKTDRWELRLLCWKAQQTTSIHGHGRSACAFRILRGSATESIVGERDRTWAPGTVVEESDPELVHQVGNAAGDALLTIHAYSPPLPVDAPSSRHGRDVVIVGGGFAGAAVAYHLLKRATPDLRVTIVERGPYLGRGVAYGVDSRLYRLNVPASRMSIDPDKADDFVSWANAEAEPHAFLSRALYGRYVVDRLARMIRRSKGKLRLHRGDVMEVGERGVTLSSGELLSADVTVLATGLAPRIAPHWLVDDARVIDAWDECGLAAIPPEGRILILGTGLSALDVMSLLNARGHRGTALILSRRGLLPRPHLEPYAHTTPLPKDAIDSAPTELRGLLRWVRGIVQAHVERGAPWQLGIDSLRPHVTTLWQKLGPADRAKFAKSIRPYWDVLRHRAPADALRVIDRWVEEKRLEQLAGKVTSVSASADGLTVDIKLRGGGRRREKFDAIVRCIGPALEHADAEIPIVDGLVQRGLAARCASGLGIETDSEGALIDFSGRSSSSLFAIGALRRASAWETTAVPDISVHARALAVKLMGSPS